MHHANHFEPSLCLPIFSNNTLYKLRYMAFHHDSNAPTYPKLMLGLKYKPYSFTGWVKNAVHGKKLKKPGFYMKKCGGTISLFSGHAPHSYSYALLYTHCNENIDIKLYKWLNHQKSFYKFRYLVYIGFFFSDSAVCSCNHLHIEHMLNCVLL